MGGEMSFMTISAIAVVLAAVSTAVIMWLKMRPRYRHGIEAQVDQFNSGSRPKGTSISDTDMLMTEAFLLEASDSSNNKIGNAAFRETLRRAVDEISAMKNMVEKLSQENSALKILLLSNGIEIPALPQDDRSRDGLCDTKQLSDTSAINKID